MSREQIPTGNEGNGHIFICRLRNSKGHLISRRGPGVCQEQLRGSGWLELGEKYYIAEGVAGSKVSEGLWPLAGIEGISEVLGRRQT